jgi:hypothetical protein
MTALLVLSGDPPIQHDVIHLVCNLVMMVISLGILILMLYVGCKVYKIVKFNEKVISLLISMLCVTWLAKMIFYILNAYMEYNHPGQKDSPSILTVNILSVTGLTISITINLRNWMFYYIKIGEMAYHHQYADCENNSVSGNWYLMHVHNYGKRYAYLVNGIALLMVLTFISIGSWICVLYG